MKNSPIDETPKNIMVDLDVLLDTRLAMLYVLSEDTASELVGNGKYFKRVRDNFGNISANIFNTMFKLRNKSILKFALPTNIFKVINEITAGLTSDAIDLKDVTLYINTFPYQLTDDEKVVVEGMLGGLIRYCNYEIVYMDNVKDLTPSWVIENVQTIIKYDGLDWLETHNKLLNLQSNPMLDKTLIIPAVVSGPVKKSYKLDSKFFITVAATMKSLIRVQFVDTVYFSSMMEK